MLAYKYVGVRSRPTELPCLYDVINMNIETNNLNQHTIYYIFTNIGINVSLSITH